MAGASISASVPPSSVTCTPSAWVKRRAQVPCLVAVKLLHHLVKLQVLLAAGKGAGIKTHVSLASSQLPGCLPGVNAH